MNPVIVTTEYRGVFFGYEISRHERTIKLARARNCIYWDKSLLGFVGLAVKGPNAQCKIGPAADIELYGITAVLKAEPDAVAAWEAAPWAR